MTHAFITEASNLFSAPFLPKTVSSTHSAVAPPNVGGRQLLSCGSIPFQKSDKHLLTPRGVVPLRRFFTGGTETASGEEISWDAIKAALQEVIDQEDKGNPLSDDALADKLKERGIEIARRTVAKYRGQLGIPSARLRKQF